MAAKEVKEIEPEEKVEKEITYTCKYCNKAKTFNDMKIIRRYFPPVIVCLECATKLNRNEQGGED